MRRSIGGTGMRGPWRAVIGLLVLLALAIGGPARAEPVKLRVGYDVVPLHLAPVIFKFPEVMRHYGKDYTVDFIRFRGSALQLQALATHEVDLAVLAYSTFATGILNGHLPIEAVADVGQDGPSFSTVFAVRDASPIHTIADLKGKTIAVNAFGGAVDVAARSVLLKHGLTPGSGVNFIEANFPSMEALVKENKVQVGTFLAPFWAAAQRDGGLRPLFDQKDGLGTTQFLFYATTRDVITAHRAVLVDFFEDYLRGLHAVLDPKNRDRVLKVIAELAKQPESAFAPWALRPGKDYYHDPNGLVNATALQRNIDQLAELGMIPKSFDVAPYIDSSLVKDAGKRL